MKSIDFNNNTSKKIYANYIKRTKKVISALSLEDRNEILMEFNSHIFEAINNKQSTTESEIDILVNVLEKLGEPEEILKPLVADKKMTQATKTFNPVHIFKALALNIGNGISYFLFSIIYLSLFGFIYAIIMKIINPIDVGVYFQNGSFDTLGTYTGYTEEDNVVEVLGNWFIPVMVACVLVLFVVITLMLRFKQKRKQ